MKTTIKIDKKEVSEFCKRFNITEAQFLGKEKIIGHLYLSNNQLTKLPEGFNPTVGGDLYLSNNQLTKLPEGFNPTVGGDLYLSNNKKELATPVTKKPENNLISWCGKYIKADGIFTEILQKRGNAYKIKKVNSDKIFWLVTDGKFTHAHGDTLKKATEDFKFKFIAEKLKKDPIKKDTVITVMYYRTVTGACEFGCIDWINKNIPEKKVKGILANGIKAVDLLPLLEKSGKPYGYDKIKQLINW